MWTMLVSFPILCTIITGSALMCSNVAFLGNGEGAWWLIFGAFLVYFLIFLAIYSVEKGLKDKLNKEN